MADYGNVGIICAGIILRGDQSSAESAHAKNVKIISGNYGTASGEGAAIGTRNLHGNIFAVSGKSGEAGRGIVAIFFVHFPGEAGRSRVGCRGDGDKLGWFGN